jgi:hypothetical protein
VTRKTIRKLRTGKKNIGLVEERMHGIGKGRKKGARNKTQLERMVEAIVTAGGGNYNDVVTILQDHYDAAVRRNQRGQNPVRSEFLEVENTLKEKYLTHVGLDSVAAQDAMEKLVEYSKNTLPVVEL